MGEDGVVGGQAGLVFGRCQLTVGLQMEKAHDGHIMDMTSGNSGLSGRGSNYDMKNRDCGLQ